jgi:hypothetical protein
MLLNAELGSNKRSFNAEHSIPKAFASRRSTHFTAAAGTLHKIK